MEEEKSAVLIDNAYLSKDFIDPIKSEKRISIKL